jgi:hypothetical protein
MSRASDQHIAELDAALTSDGEDIVLRRVVGTSNQTFIDVPCRAFVRGYEVKDLIPGISQRQRKVILSPTQINRAQWPGGQPQGSSGDPRVPSKGRGDKCRVAGEWTTVETATGTMVDGELVRIEMRVLG